MGKRAEPRLDGLREKIQNLRDVIADQAQKKTEEHEKHLEKALFDVLLFFGGFFLGRLVRILFGF